MAKDRVRIELMIIAGLVLSTVSVLFPMQSTPPAPGVPRTLAQERTQRVKDLRYAVEFVIPAERTAPVTGRVTITFTLTDASRPLALDFSEPGRVISTSAKSLSRVPDHLVIQPADLHEGKNDLTIEFVAGDAALNRNPEFLYTLFVPARAHLAFPCFDQPDLKARWTLTLTYPSGWQALANGAPLEEVRLKPDATRDGNTASDRPVRTFFKETEPLSTYLFAFAAGRFSIETGERAGRTFRMFHRETDAAKVAQNRDAIFDLHAAALTWLERYTGIPYPWDKFDFLLVPSFQFGGMEHPGAVFYNASGLLLDPSATQNQKLGRASLIAHETSHMWFGDLVTMRWFNDVWMKEVFANFMAAKIVNPSFPEINHELRFLLAHYPAAYDIDRTAGTNAIRQNLDNLDEAGTLYGAIIYQKAPIVMRQLENIVGSAGLQQGLQQYLRAHRFGNASWSDLIALLDARTPADLAAWSHAWVEEAGRPIIRTILSIERGKIGNLAFAQRDPIEHRSLTWNQHLQVTIGLPEGAQQIPVQLSGPRTEVPAARGLPKPLFILPTGGGVGYGGFELDTDTLTYLRAHLPEIDDPLTRGAAWVTLWEQMLDGRVAASDMIALGLRALPLESDEQNVQRVLGYIEAAYWKFLPAGRRAETAEGIEPVLIAGLRQAATPSLKSAWFSALRDTARSPSTIAWLERIWRKQEEVPGLILTEPDYTTLALQLAVREVPAWNEILDQQLARIENPDRKARFAFVRPALSPDQSVRDAFFEGLKDVANRQREPWVLEGLNYLHHPLRAASSEKYIPASLALVRDIQRTGDIFFPKRWMDATLGGHSSASVAQMITRFLAELPPDYPDRLRRVILSASDDLLRASRIER
jgi:aminopeptidase N